MNKWKEIASLFQLELEEIFEIKGEESYTFKFLEHGFYSRKNDGCWFSSPNTLGFLQSIIEKPSLIIKKPWKPKLDEWYWTFSVKYGSCHYRWESSSIDLENWKLGNYFKTQEEAELKGKELIEKLKEEYDNA